MKSTYKNILFITSSFDKKGSASIRNISLVNGLVENGINVDVLTEFWPENMVDNSLQKLINPKVKIYKDHIKVIDAYFGNNIKASGKTQKINFKGKALSVIKEILRQLYFFPDIDKEWIKSYSKILPYNNYDLIISSSDTKTAHFIGYALSKKYHVTWFTYWGDPWKDDMGTKGIKKIIAGHYEHKFLREADHSFYTSKPTLVQMRSRFPEISTMDFLKRAYLTKIVSDRGKQKSLNDDITISYCGSIYYGRNINSFFESLINYNATATENKIYVEMYGVYPAELTQKYSSSYISFHGQVNYEKVREVTANSDALLMIMNDSSSNQIPGKLFDYFGTDKCILVLAGDKRNTVENFIDSTGRCHIIHDINFDDIARWAHETYWPLEEYSSKAVASELLRY